MNEMSPVMEIGEAANRSGNGYRAALDALATEFGRLVKADARGELAALRRLEPEHPGNGTFFRLLARAVPGHLLGRSDADPDAPGSRLDVVRRWALVVTIMAQRPDALSRGNLGQSLKGIGYSDQRLNMLLNARGPTFRNLAWRAARRLARDDQGLPYRELGRLVLLDGRAEHDLEAEDLRVRIAMEFQRASGPEDSSDDNDQSE
jgi:hypothetical protein